MELCKRLERVARMHYRRTCSHVDRHPECLDHLLARSALLDRRLDVEANAIIATDSDGNR
jgi:hypothetical protein